MRIAQFNLSAPSSTVWTSLRLFSGTRILVALLLLVSVLTSDSRVFESPAALHRTIAVVILYGVLAIFILPLGSRLHNRFYSLLLGQVILDLIVLGWLLSVTAGLKSGLGLLFLLPVAGAAALSPLVLALIVAALSTLEVLLDAWLRTFNVHTNDQSLLMLAGLNGGLFFLTAIFINRVAHRLLTQEELVNQREMRIQNQLEVNRLIIGDMHDGVIVLDEMNEILAVNPAAKLMLGTTPSNDDIQHIKRLPRWQKVWAEFLRHKQEHPSLDAPTVFQSNAILHFIDNQSQFPRVQLRFLRPTLTPFILKTDQTISTDGGVVIVLLDLSQIEQRAQQLKLASLGRLSASIAHEVRNPLSAIRHASALLAEDKQNLTHERLTRIIEINSLRINQIIEDVLQISRRESAQPERLALSRFLRELLFEYQRDQQVIPGRIQTELLIDDDVKIDFDSAHLRRILLNLLNNACRYASQSGGAIRIWVGIPEETLVISVANDGPPLSQEQQAHLFEPFYTTEVQGTGLGLFLSRELCEANRAHLSYEPQPPWLKLVCSENMDQIDAPQSFAGAFVIHLRTDEAHLASD